MRGGVERPAEVVGQRDVLPEGLEAMPAVEPDGAHVVQIDPQHRLGATPLQVLEGGDEEPSADAGTLCVGMDREVVDLADPVSPAFQPYHPCLLYTSDAADDLTRVDLGGRRI